MSSPSSKTIFATIAAATLCGSAAAGLGDELPVEFTMAFTSESLGAVVLTQVFDAEVDISGVTFEDGAGMFDVANPGYDFFFSDLDVSLVNDTISGTGDALLESFEGDTFFDFSFDGFGTAWDGTSAEGIGFIQFTPEGGFTVDTHEIAWSVVVVPAPSVLAVLALAGAGSRRRRD
ncbi:MAG: hypothetical protein VX012_08925 [Planctomycetota bacterium]|nr:hypothetical protein [Planctomycetota bacterium]